MALPLNLTQAAKLVNVSGTRCMPRFAMAALAVNIERSATRPERPQRFERLERVVERLLLEQRVREAAQSSTHVR